MTTKSRCRTPDTSVIIRLLPNRNIDRSTEKRIIRPNNVLHLTLKGGRKSGLPMVKRIAARLSRQVNTSVSLTDMGGLGLIIKKRFEGGDNKEVNLEILWCFSKI